ncbi:hypothetical protein ACWGNM_17170 [Streptomyces sp. NPDC055796]
MEAVIMVTKLTMAEIDAPQSLFVPYQNHEGSPELLIVYSGVMRFAFSIGEDETTGEIWSWVPYVDQGGIQDFKSVRPDAVASGSLSVWTHPEDNVLAGLDKLVPEFRIQPSLVPPTTPQNKQPIALVLKASIRAFNCGLEAIPYNVTVRVRPKVPATPGTDPDLSGVIAIPDPAGFERVVPPVGATPD